jgi:NAD(P)-dependent dehydrogenase (short-subunit alcohol dehydrogenase family)
MTASKLSNTSNSPAAHLQGNLFDLSGKVALITGAGANGGIGHALALGFSRYGAQVIAADIDDAGAQTTAEEISAQGGRGAAYTCDIANPDQVDALFGWIDHEVGKLDILVNVPYIFPSRVRPHELALEDWQRTLGVNLTGYFLCAQQAIARMIAQRTHDSESGGSIVNISSIAGVSALGRGNFPYSVSKAGVNQMTRELAVEYAAWGIRVNAIAPAQVATATFKRNMLGDARFNATLRPRLMAGIPLNRFLEPEEFVGPAVFLCSAAASAVTGVILPVDGGNLALNAGGNHTWPTDG